ncbi:MAG: phenylalanine--tRNA ligase beta subunit-related protein [Bacillota bacterium]|nr:phenylalanine--tRNA ligase beta subunit-related protein [Bacillota bacterium]
MVNVRIDESLKERCAEAALGLLQCKVEVYEDPAEFLALLNGKIAELSEVELSQANKRDKIQSTRKAYKALGKEPNRYRSSAEAMCRRIAKERGLYYINNVVDINNYLSIKSGYSMGTYDLAHTTGDITWMRAPEGTAYRGIGKDVLNIEFLPVLFDGEGPFGNPTSDNDRTMITEATKDLLLVYYAFDGDGDLPALLEEAKELLEKYAGGTDFETKILI